MASVTDIQPRGKYSPSVRKKQEERTAKLKGCQKMQNSKSAEADMIRYRDRCRVGMVRYRVKKRNVQLQLEMSVEQGGEAVETYGDVPSRIRIFQNPWNIVFQVLEITFQTSWPIGEIISNVETRSVLGFCERSFSSEMAMGYLRGIEALINQLRQYAQYFGSPKLRLQRVEWMARGVLTATANLTLNLTELTLQYIFSQGQAYTGRDEGGSNGYQ
ncbi:LOW QUALITY PROTEIN: Bzip transcription factor [Phytophthora megakarya]|uniref:Bzip transcription factor n=1 Tax=Phytophthora megakarya TaxID=4795 RepID=A0A225UD04_9STRA|nr:LOW QUALITY PROTEIN: Bzip transcription factor [Phytophthora megakarya]